MLYSPSLRNLTMIRYTFLLFGFCQMLLTVSADPLDLDVKWLLGKIKDLEQKTNDLEHENAVLKEKVDTQLASQFF